MACERQGVNRIDVDYAFSAAYRFAYLTPICITGGDNGDYVLPGNLQSTGRNVRA
jgi:hypothetical protein